MIEVESASLENVAFFKKAKVVLNKNPLTFIRGLNLDSDPASPTGNGAGKSVLFSIVPTVAFATPPTSRKKKAKKEVLRKSSKMCMTLKSHDGARYEIEQTVSKYKISKDGVDTLIRTTPLAEAAIRETIFPLSEIEFYSHCYVSTLKPYLMHFDTDSNRLEHLTSIFRLDDYAMMQKHFATKLSGVKDNEVRLSLLLMKQAALAEKLKKVLKKVSDKKLARYRKEHKTLEVKITDLVGREFAAMKTQQVLITLGTIEVDLDELRSKYASKKPPKEFLAWLREQKSLVKAEGEYAKLKKQYKQTVKSIQDKIDEIKLPKRSSKELREEFSKNEKLLGKLQPIIDDLEDKERAWKTANKKVAALEEDGKEYADELEDVNVKDDFASEIEGLKISLRLQKLLNHDHLDGNKCPTCMSEVDLENIRKVVQKAKKKLPALERKLEIQRHLIDLKAAQKAQREVKFDSAKLGETRLSVTGLEEINEDLTKGIRVWKRITELKEQLDDVEAPRAPKVASSTELSYKELDAQIDMCNAILAHVNAKAKLLENNEALSDCRSAAAVRVRSKEVGEALDKISAELLGLRTRSGDLSRYIEKYTNFNTERDLYAKELAELEAEIAQIKPELEDKRVLETLVKAYSPKGLKTYAANLICSLIQSNLNLYRPLIFAEPFTFTAEATSTGLSIKVDRGRGSEISDVRSLSGAESDCFCLLFLLSLLPLIPDARRVSMVTLDEPTAHCDEATRRLFIESYLPALCEVVPHVYVITNHPDDNAVGATEMLVRKKNGVSALVTV